MKAVCGEASCDPPQNREIHARYDDVAESIVAFFCPAVDERKGRVGHRKKPTPVQGRVTPLTFHAPSLLLGGLGNTMISTAAQATRKQSCWYGINHNRGGLHHGVAPQLPPEGEVSVLGLYAYFPH